MRRGLTLLELVVSIGLLVALMSVVAGWIGIAAEATSGAGESTTWSNRARTVLRLIHDDIQTFDITERMPQREDIHSARIHVANQSLTITTREPATGP